MLEGACSNHPYPDMWFPEQTQGKQSRQRFELLAEQTLLALSYCETCPVKAECLEIGMQPRNAENGIWGGTLPGERLAMRGRSVKTTPVRDAIVFAERIRAWQSVTENLG